jgi:hypothetical protein
LLRDTGPVLLDQAVNLGLELIPLLAEAAHHLPIAVVLLVAARYDTRLFDQAACRPDGREVLLVNVGFRLEGCVALAYAVAQLVTLALVPVAA